MGNRQSNPCVPSGDRPDAQTRDTPSSSAPIPMSAHSNSLSSAASASNASFKVFISHAGEDKVTIAIPLREILHEQGITAFVDMEDMAAGTEAVPAMIHAMETASIGVIIMSPEFVARKWPMKELMHFLKRRDESKAAGVEGPTIIPFFYRLGISELYDEPRLDRKDKDGNELYQTSRFYERQQNGEPEANIAEIKAALSKLHGTMGLENFVNANNDNSFQMRFNRNTMLVELANKIREAVPVPERAVEGTIPAYGGDVRCDMFRAYFDETHNVSDLVFDFEKKEDCGSTCTQEGKILEILLDRSIDKNRTIAIQGIAGVGKTSLLRKIRSLKKVLGRFRDGVYCIELGKHITCEGLKEALIRAVSKSGGKKTASDMRTERDMRALTEAFRCWFANKSCLFVIDDVWETKAMTSDTIHELWHLHTNGKDSKTLLTTRSKEVASDAEAYAVLKPRETLGAESREILYHYAGLKPESGQDEDNGAVDEILRRCAGLPLFLSVAGKSVKTLSFRTGHNGCMAYRVYADQLRRSMSDMMNKGAGWHAGLSKRLQISVELVEKRKDGFEFDLSCSMREMHRRLSVMKKQMRVPMTMLKHLWELENESEAARIAKEFEQVGLADVEYEKGESETKFMEVLQLHDSVYEFTVYETNRFKEEGVGHEKILEGYGKKLNGSGGQGERREWWSEVLENDEYIHENICRHLIGAGLEDELFELLLSPEWLYRQLELNGAAVIQVDFSAGIEVRRSMKVNADDPEEDEMEEALELIQEAFTLSASYISRNGREVWFQVHGRLKSAGKFNKLVREYLSRIERNAPKPGKPRLLCMNSFLHEAGGSNTRIIPIGKKMFCMTLFSDGERVACGCERGEIAIVNVRRGQIENRWRAHDKSVNALDVGKDGTRIVSGSGDGTAKVWDAQSGLHIATLQLSGHSDSVRCVAMTQDGSRVVCSFSDNTVQVWNLTSGWQLWYLKSGWREGRSIKLENRTCLTVFKDGEHVLMRGENGGFEIWNVMTKAKVGASFGTHISHFCYVAMTEDESRLVSAAQDDLRLWDMETCQQIGNSFEGHILFITCVAASADGRRIVSADEDIRVWDVGSGEQVGDPLIGHKHNITGLSLLDQDTIISCSIDGTLRVWNLKKKKSKNSTVTYHESVFRWVSSVSFSLNGKFVVSGSTDGTLQMWDATSGQRAGQPLEAASDDSEVCAVAVTPNGRFVVSVVDKEGYRRIEVWDIETREVIRTTRGYHCNEILCVTITPNGECVITGSRDRIVRVWNLASMPRPRFTLEGHNAGVVRVFVSDDGKRIVSVDVEAEIIVWDIKTRAETKRKRKEGALQLSRTKLFVVVGENIAHGESGLSIRQESNQIVYGEGSNAFVLGTLDNVISEWDISSDQKTMCVGLHDGQVGIVKLEL